MGGKRLFCLYSNNHLNENLCFLQPASFNPLTTICDQDRISPYNIKQTSDENEEKY